MNKIVLTALFFSLALLGYAQSISKNIIIPSEQEALSRNVQSVDPGFSKISVLKPKAFGDTIFFEDFDGGLPAGWTIVNNNLNNFVWTWDTLYRNGQFSSPGNIITSTSAANGFMSLPSDFYNTPIPGTGAVPMNTYFESDSIDLTKNGTHPNGFPSVWLTYQQTIRYCCSGANRLELQVSADNFTTFQEYDATNAMPVSSASGTVINVIKINAMAANATSIKIRFISEGNSHYYWMIDDFAIIEGSQNDLALEDPYLGFNSSYDFNPFYYQIPYGLFTPVELTGNNVNYGTNTLTRVRLEGDFVHLADRMGNPGQGTVFSSSSTPVTLLSGNTDTAIANAPYFVPTVLGEYRVDLLANSDSVNQNILAAIHSQNFATTDTILARDDNSYGGGTGPGSYVRNGQTGGTAVGDKFGTLYVVEPRSGNGGTANIPTSITYAVSSDPANIGVEISPKIWKYEEDSLYTAGTIGAAFAGGVVASSFIPYTIQAASLNTLLTLPLDLGPAVTNGLDSGQYVVGWEVTNTNGGNSFEVQNDASSAQYQKGVTCFINFGHIPGWGWVDVNPVIRMNFGNMPVSTSIQKTITSNSSFSITPNPNNGLFELALRSKNVRSYQIEVRNSLGQLVFTDQLNSTGELKKTYDFSDFETGVYYLNLLNPAEKLVRRIVIQ